RLLVPKESASCRQRTKPKLATLCFDDWTRRPTESILLMFIAQRKKLPVLSSVTYYPWEPKYCRFNPQTHLRWPRVSRQQMDWISSRELTFQPWLEEQSHYDSGYGRLTVMSFGHTAEGSPSVI